MIKKYSILADHKGMRIDKWIKDNISKLPQSLIERYLRVGKIKINKKKTKSSYKLALNDVVVFYGIDKLKFETKDDKFSPSKKLLKNNEKNVIYNDDDLIVVNKKSGIAVQSGTKSYKNLTDIFSSSNIFRNNKPYTVHRLDKDTSGLLIIAKNRKSAQLLTTLFRIRKIQKKYLAICDGYIDGNFKEWKHKLKKFENNKIIYEDAITKVKILNSNLNYSYIELKPITGRKHQLRKQSSICGCPIVGDTKYSNKKYNKINLMLHASEIKFKINDKKYKFNAPLPDYFLNFLKIKHLTV